MAVKERYNKVYAKSAQRGVSRFDLLDWCRGFAIESAVSFLGCCDTRVSNVI